MVMPDDKPRALVAEDTELGCWAVAHALRAEGFDVSVAVNRADAIGRMAGTRFAVMVTAVSGSLDDISELVGRFRENQPDAGRKRRPACARSAGRKPSSLRNP
jgi:CheY-like chemotaxis protein